MINPHNITPSGDSAPQQAYQQTVEAVLAQKRAMPTVSAPLKPSGA